MILKMGFKYGPSTLGKTILLEENFGAEGTPPSKYINILINVVLSLWIILAVSVHYVTLRRELREGGKTPASSTRGRKAKGQSSLGQVTQLFIAFMVNNALRCSHMIDHVCRPVYYHEPIWAHAKIYITEMEVPTYAHFITALVAVEGMKRMMRVAGGQGGLRGAIALMSFYVFASLFNLVHYTVEPPSNYGPFPNFNIAGTGVTNLPIIFLLGKICWGLRKGGGGSSMTGKGDTQELLESKRVTRSSTSNTRRRSKTPVKK